MSFISDKQTLEDLGLLGKFRSNSVFSIFNKVKTAGGERLLNEMFHNPMTTPEVINERSSIFSYFHKSALRFPFTAEAFSLVEAYLGNESSGNIVASVGGTLWKKATASFLRDDQYTTLQSGLSATVTALAELKELVARIEIPMIDPARKILADKRLAWITPGMSPASFSLLSIASYDHLLRHTLREEMDQLLEIIYALDVYMSVSDVARERGFSYGLALPMNENVFEAKALQHPGLLKAVANPVSLNASQNLVFLTGANMAGKSTFMKSVGIAVYLAHMGFPVAATGLRFSVCDGLYTSINVPDNLEMGYSHFYAEVLRVKKVAQEVSSKKRLLIIFDELFKGTNVKDAYDATLAVTSAFSRYRNCFFIISTHIIEVGEALKKDFASIRFSYLPTIMNGNTPTYTYRLTDGITSDRQGMTIIENEKILEALYS